MSVLHFLLRRRVSPPLVRLDGVRGGTFPSVVGGGESGPVFVRNGFHEVKRSIFSHVVARNGRNGFHEVRGSISRPNLVRNAGGGSYTTSAYEDGQDPHEYIAKATFDAQGTQEKILQEILEKNSAVSYLASHGLEGKTDVQSFKTRIPVVDYTHIKDYMEKLAKGEDSNLICSDQISFLTSCSGKLIPMTKGELTRRSNIFRLLDPLASSRYPDFSEGRVMFLFHVQSRSEGGGVPILSEDSIFEKLFCGLNNTSPREAIYCTDLEDSIYAQLVCGLFERDNVTRIGIVSAGAFLSFLNFLEKNLPALDYDIRTGVLHRKFKDDSLRKVVLNVLKPDPALGRIIGSLNEKKNKEEMLKILWPNLKYLEVVVTKNLANDLKMLEFKRHGLPLLCRVYVAFEGFYAISVFPPWNLGDSEFMVIPTSGYYEFVDVHTDEVVELVEVEEGREYHPVITTYTGIYRLKLECVLTVACFYSGVPLFRF